MMQSTSPKLPIPSTTADRQIMLFLFAALLAIYLRSLAPGLLAGDSGEFQFAAWRLGLAHATGYPLYLLAGWLWQHLLAVLRISPATSLNVFSAVIGAAAVAALYRLLVDWLPGSLSLRRVVALFAALFLALNPTFWSQNLIAEVYTLQVLLMVLVLWQVRKLEIGDWEIGRLEVGHEINSPPATRHFQLSTFNFQLFAFVYGLALTHHATAIFMAPGLLIAAWLLGALELGRWRMWIGGLLALLLPLLLYLYVPLRSGINASPWTYLQLSGQTISLYGTGWQGFVDFVSGRSISVGFNSTQTALANLSQAWTLWQLHFGWSGLILMAFGLFSLLRKGNWLILAITLPFALILQLFNLFYAIGDILVYYIPLYLVGVIWAAWGVALVGEMIESWSRGSLDPKHETTNYVALGVVAIFFLLPLQHYQRYQAILDQSNETLARSSWQTILAAKPEANAILVSNDRNEMVPLYYLQHVENFATSLTALFPLITPDAGFADIGATLETALQSGQPVYLIKPMPGLEVRFDLAAANPPLVKVVGQAMQQTAQVAVNQPLGGLTLLGYDWDQGSGAVQITLHWQVEKRLEHNYTTTVQLFDAAGEKINQDDSPPGGEFYPTSLWKAGERLLDRHILNLPTDKQATTMLIGMYTGQEFTPLAPPITLEIHE